MALFKWFRKRVYSWQNPEILKETLERAQEVRQNEADIRRLIHRRKVLEQKLKINELNAELSDLSHEITGDDDNTQESSETGIDDMLKTIISTALMSKLAGNQAQGITPPFPQVLPGAVSSSPETAQAIPDETIRREISLIPKKWRKMARNMDNETLKGFIRKQTSYSETTIERALEIFRSENF